MQPSGYSSARTFWHRSLLPVATILVWPTLASGDTGIPTLAVFWPLTWVVLPLVIAIEASVARRVLQFNWRRAFRLSAAANLASTLLGVPIAWLVAFLLLLVVGTVAQFLPSKIATAVIAPFYAAWLPPIEPEQSWLVPAAAVVLCLPTYFASVWIELRVARRIESSMLTEQLKLWATVANRLSYGAVAIAVTAIAAFFYFVR